MELLATAPLVTKLAYEVEDELELETVNTGLLLSDVPNKVRLVEFELS